MSFHNHDILWQSIILWHISWAPKWYLKKISNLISVHLWRNSKKGEYNFAKSWCYINPRTCHETWCLIMEAIIILSSIYIVFILTWYNAASPMFKQNNFKLWVGWTKDLNPMVIGCSIKMYNRTIAYITSARVQLGQSLLQKGSRITTIF